MPLVGKKRKIQKTPDDQNKSARNIQQQRALLAKVARLRHEINRNGEKSIFKWSVLEAEERLAYMTSLWDKIHEMMETVDWGDDTGSFAEREELCELTDEYLPYKAKIRDHINLKQAESNSPNFCDTYNEILLQIREIFAIEFVENSTSLRQLAGTLQDSYNQLLGLLSAEQIGEFAFMHILESQMDAETRAEWENSFKAEALPTLQQMLEFCDSRDNPEETVKEASLPPPSPSPPQTPSPINIISSAEVSPQRKPSTPPRRLRTAPDCDLCIGEEHWPFKCPKFNALSVIERKAYFNQRIICKKCLSSSHTVENCTETPCSKCEKAENLCACNTLNGKLQEKFLKRCKKERNGH